MLVNFPRMERAVVSLSTCESLLIDNVVSNIVPDISSNFISYEIKFGLRPG